MSIFRATGRAFAQLDDLVFVRVILLGFALSALFFAALLAGLLALLPLLPGTGIPWLDGAIAWGAGLGIPLVVLLSMWLLFPAVMTTMLGLFLEDVVDAVEARHYADARGRRRSSLAESLWLAVRLSCLVALANLVALPLYLALLVTGIGAPVLYLALNAWLLGREYFEMAALRHAAPKDAAHLRRAIGGEVFLAGLVIAGLFVVPVVNLLAPVIGAAIMVHLLHASRRRALAAPGRRQRGLSS